VIAVFRVKRGDTVEVITGDERGARGIVQRVLPDKDRVVVQGVNVVKKHQRPIQAGRGQVRAGIIEFEAPIHLSNVMLVCPECAERTRVGYYKADDGTTVRVCKFCEADID
jgi:large subunit ribosomal protein L24